MSKTMQWLPALVLLGAGFLGGYLVGGGESPSGGGAGDELTADPDATGATGATKTLTAEGAGPTLETGGDPHGLAAVIARIPPPEVPAGDGHITGRVTDDAANPIAGASVRVEPKRPASMTAGREDEPLQGYVSRMIAMRRWSDLASREGVSGADGRFDVAGLADGEHSVRVTHDDYRIRPQDHRAARSAQPGADLAFTATAQVEVTVEVFLPDGSQPQNANVDFSGGSMNRGMGWQPSHKILHVAPGAYQVTARGGDGGYKSPAQTVNLAVGQPASLTFHLEGSPALRGTLQYAEGEALETCLVRLVRLAPGVKADAALLMGSDKTEWVHGRRRRGAHDFTFGDLVPGRYLVGVCRSHNGAIVVMETVDVGRGPADVVLKLPALQREEYVVVTVLGPGGRAIPNVRASTGYTSERSSTTGGGTYLRRPDGTLWVLHCEGGDSLNPGTGEYSIEITAGGFGKMRKTYKRGRAVELTFRFEATADVRVSIAGLVGSRYEGRVHVRVNAADVSEMMRMHRGEKVQLDEKGEGLVSGLQPGTFVVTGTLGERGMGSSIFEQEFEVTVAGASVRVTLPELYVVTVTGAEGHCWLAQKNGRSHRTAQADKDGRAVIDGVPAGTYTVRSGKKRKEITLPGTTGVDLR